MNKSDQEILNKALDLAKKVHSSQTRDDGSPYINHITGVIDILTKELGVKHYYELSVAALHDVIEDSEYTKQDLTAMFGKDIAEGVQALSKTKGTKIEDYFNQINANRVSGRLWIVKIADRIYNIRDLEKIIETKPEKVLKYIKETEEYFIPVAQKMGTNYLNLLSEALENIKKLVKLRDKYS